MHNASAPIAGADPAFAAETRVVSAVRAAAAATGVSFEFLLAQANQESGLDPAAHNARSSAAGLYQFTATTWLSMVKRHGAAYGLGKYAASIHVDRNGKPYVADAATRHAILELRRDPKTSAIMAAEYAKQNQRSLEHRLGRPVSASDLYLAHFLGAAGAAKVLERMDVQPRRDAAGLLPDAARANPELFHEPGSRHARSVASLYRSVQASFSDAVEGVQPMEVRAELASLRPEPRPDDAPGTTTAEAANLPPPPAVAASVPPPTPYFPVPLPPPVGQQLSQEEPPPPPPSET